MMKLKKRPIGVAWLSIFYGFLGTVILLQPIAFVLVGRNGQPLPAQAWMTVGFTWLIGILCGVGAWGLWTKKNIVRLAVIGVSTVTFIHYGVQYFRGIPNPPGYFLFLLLQIGYLVLPGVKRYFLGAVETTPPPTAPKKKKKKRKVQPMESGQPPAEAIATTTDGD